MLAELGATVVAVNDSRGGVYNPGGLHIDALLAHKRLSGSVVGLAAADQISNAELLEIDCDVLVPAALGIQIGEENAPRIRARLIAEAANAPITPAADRILYDQGCFVLPDVLAGAGGITVSYFEWVQGLQEFFWTEREVYAQLERVMARAFQSVLSLAQQNRVHMRTAAYMLAVQRVADAVTTRGIYP
jgi:glutamate dehydrogenase (NAD(P)+)